MPKWQDHHTTQAAIAACVFVWLICAVDPWDFEAWLLEQFATVLGIMVLGWCIHHRVRFSTSAKITIALLFVIHTIGTHYTYSETPYDTFIANVTGISINTTFGWERNHYDRFVHLMYGVCLAIPIADTITQQLKTKLFTSRFLAFHLVLSTSALYELIEWIAALLFGGDLGMMYLGTQGDIWDAQADMALASIGQLVVYLGLLTRSTATKMLTSHKHSEHN